MRLKEILLLLITLFVIYILNISEQAEADWKKSLKNFKNNAVKKIEDTKKKTENIIEKSQKKKRENKKGVSNEWGQKLKDFSQEYGEKTSQEINKLRQQYGRKIVDEIEETYKDYGPIVGESVKNTYTKYGPQAGNFIKKTYQSHGVEAGDIIKNVYETHGKDMGETLKTSFEKYGQKTGIMIATTINDYGPTIATTMEKNVEKYGPEIGISLQKTYREYAPYVKDAVKNKENQKKVMLTISTVDVVFKHSKHYTKEATANTMRQIIKNVTINTETNKEISLEKYAQLWIRKNVPYLIGTDIERDPAKAATYVLLYTDINYSYKELKILKNKDGKTISLNEALYSSPIKNADNALEVLDLIDNFSELTDEDASLSDITSTANALKKGIEIYNK